MSKKPLESDRELGQVLQLVSSSQKDPDALQHARERADLIRQEMRAKYGTRNMAVELVQKARNGE